MRVTVKKWGNSASVRIPTGVLKAAKLKVDDEVDVREENGRIIIEPLRSHDYNLSELLNAVTADNCHSAKTSVLPWHAFTA
jgi:antitoxin MazE